MEPSPVVDIRGLVKTYGDFRAVRDLSLQVHPGEVFVLLGPNGAGKTTTIRMLMGILKPTGGTASILGGNCFRRWQGIVLMAVYVGFVLLALKLGVAGP